MDEKIVTIWQESLDVLRGELTPVTIDTWMRPLIPFKIEGNTFSFVAPYDMIKDQIETKYKGNIVSAINTITQDLYNIEIIVGNIDELKEKNPTNNSNDFKPVPVDPDEYNSNQIKNTLNPKYVFNSFVIGNSNRFAHAACMAVAENPAKAYNPLFIYGGVGLGKTHLMHAIGHFILNNNPDSKVVYVSSEKFTNELVNSIRDNRNEEFRDKYRNIDVLLIDDVQFIAGKEKTQEEFFHTFNALHESNKQIILSSDRPPNEIPTLEDRLRSRFGWGLIADVQAPDYETRIAILKKKSETEGKFIPNDVLIYVASNIKSNIRELEGALIRIIAYATLTGKAISVELATEALRGLINPSNNKTISIDLIQDLVAGHYNIRIEDLKSKKKTRNITYPRQIAMYLCRKFTDNSLPKIGEAFGGRDHSTVIHAYEKIENDKENDESLRSSIAELTKKISP